MHLVPGQCYRISERGGHTIRVMAITEQKLMPLPGFFSSYFGLNRAIDYRLIEIDSSLSIWEDTPARLHLEHTSDSEVQS